MVHCPAIPCKVTVVTPLVVDTVQILAVLVSNVTGLPEPPPVAEMMKGGSDTSFPESGANIIV